MHRWEWQCCLACYKRSLCAERGQGHCEQLTCSTLSCRTRREIQAKFPANGGANAGGVASAQQAGPGAQGAVLREEELSYAMAAARRTEKRRIVSFVCLCDSIIASTLRSMLLGAVEGAHSVAAGQAAPGGAAGEGAQPAPPLFHVSLHVSPQPGALALEMRPRAEDALGAVHGHIKACARH